MEPDPKSELIPDHSLVAGERDLFNHGDYVERLVQIIDHVDVGRTSANIALYGSWGSGKSGIANALEERLKNRDDIVYSEFEAFKFGRDPLLRNFVSQLSKLLLVTDPTRVRAYRRRLYESTSRPFVDLDRVISSHPVWCSIGAIAFCLFSAFALGLWLAPGSDYQEEAGNYFKLVGFLIFGIFLTYFTLSRSTSPATGEEEFEEIFRDMLNQLNIDGTKKRRLVVFVDELDRCAPSEVAATLEAIRTFLGVEGCIFIVAADQQVLEHALTEKLRQSTPPDPANPYYSAGSAYLDKIFQYQLAFPPLRPRRLTGYALELTEGRGGVWADPAIDREDVISILLPTHIHSPRRVKVLLNSFALSYGVAEARASRDQISDLPDRAAELAKLVCIELEFPLFARDLFIDERLVDAVLLAARLRQGDGAATVELAKIPPEIRGLGFQYAEGKLPVAQLLSEDPAEGPERGIVPPPQADGSEAVPNAGEDQDVPEKEDMEAGRSEEDERVKEQHAVQLVRYLEKTETVAGPRSDLIHLESAGAVWGLDAQTAQTLDQDARDNRRKAVSLRIAELPLEDRPKALLMLGRLVRESVGRDADNAMGSLLSGAAAAGVPLEAIAHELVRDVEAYDERRGLKGESLAGAFAIAIAADNGKLVDRILARPETLSDVELAFKTLENASRLLPAHFDSIVEVMPLAVGADAARAKAALDLLSIEQTRELLLTSAPLIGERIVAELEGSEVPFEGSEESEQDRQLRLANEAGVALGRLADLYLPSDQPSAELALLPIFELHFNGRVLLEWLPRISPLQTTEATQKVLDLVDQWVVADTVTVLRAIDPKIAKDSGSALNALDQLTAHLWNERSQSWTELPSEVRTEITRLLAGGLAPSGDKTIERVKLDIDRIVTSDEDLDRFESDERLAVDLAELGLLPRSFVADSSIKTASRTFALPAPEPRPERVKSGLRESLEWLATDATFDALSASLGEIRDGTWLEPGEQLAVELILLAALDEYEEVEAPTLASMAALLSEDFGYSTAAKIWIEKFAASPEDVYQLAKASIHSPSDELQEGIESYAARLGRKQLAALNGLAIAEAFETTPSPLFFEVAGLERADQETIADAIVELGERAENREQRTLVLDIWRQMKPTKRTTREKLIRNVLLRFAEANGSGHDLVRQRLELAKKPPSGVKEELLERLTASARDSRRVKQLEKKMNELGLSRGSKGLLRRLLGRD